MEESISANQDELNSARRAIDQLDAQIVRLIQERARLAQRIGVAKSTAARATYAPDREHEVLRHVRSEGEAGPLSGPQLTSIYRQIIAACRALERPLRVAYLGPAASFTHQASIERFGDGAEFVAVSTIPDIFAEVQHGRADFGVVAVENSTEGPVGESLDTFVEADVRVCSEIAIPIAFQLLSRSERAEVTKIYSNPMAQAQCRQWLAKNMPNIEIVTVASNSRAAAMAAEEPGTAAVANALSATEYGLNVLAAGIQDLAENYTRFYVISQDIKNQPTGSDKSAVIFSLQDQPGALRNAADIFARREINMSSIQSRPSRRKVWDYLFFVEFVGHEAEPAVREALDELRGQCVFVKLLGSWPVDES